jgi:hypothetical protein
MNTRAAVCLWGSLVIAVGCGGSSPSGRSGTGGGGGTVGGTGGSGGHAGAQATGGHAGAAGQGAGTGGVGGAGGVGTGGTGNLGGMGGGASYAVKGTVTGLTGTGLVLQDGAGHQLAVSAAGAFAFETSLPAGSSVDVTVSHQPASPTQTCVVTNGSAAALAADLTGVSVVCTTNTFAVGGTVTGLSGTGLVLQDNLGDDLPVGASGAFTFATKVASGATYTVSVKTQPSGPTQTCQVSGGSGTVGAADVTSVAVNCATDTYTIGGTISGLVGTGLVLENNAGDDLSVTGNGAFAFATPVASGHDFAVTVKAQPSSPGQVCSVSQGTGTVASANVTTVAIVCATNSYAVGGTITGLSGAGLVLQDNLGDSLSVDSGTTFTFATPVADGAAYSVTVLTQPSSPSQTCTVANGAGTIAGAAVTNVAVTCVTKTFTVGGSVVGLSGTGLTLHNGSDDLPITQNGGFTFPTAVPSGGSFAVSISAQPTGPAQTCAVTGGSGTIGGAAVTSITVNCAVDQFTLSGTVAGLSGTGLTLALDSGTTTLAVSNNGTFSFPGTLASGSSYAVTVASQPSGPSQTCTVSNGSGTIGSDNVSNVSVNCATNTYQIGGSVTGLAGMGLTLQNNLGDDVTVMADGPFVFPTSVASGAGYSVTISAQPTNPSQTCTVSAGSGGVTSGDITNVAITCTTNAYPIGGTVSGLGGSVTLHNGADTVVLSANGPFVFPTAVASGGGYAVTVTAQPTNPAQTCSVTGGTGTVAGAAVSNVTVSCVTNTYAIGGMVSGLAGSGLTLQDNGGDDLIVSGNGSFTFPTPVASGQTYAVTIKNQPSGPTQTCTLAGDTGAVGAAAVTSVSVNCATNSYTIGGTVTGLTGGGLVVQDNGGDDVAVSGPGTFAFATPVASGGMYAVTVETQPTNPWQTCAVTGGTGTVGNANVSAQIACTTNAYGVSVNVSGLAGSGLVLQDNGGDDLSVTANGTATFATAVASGQSYSVSVRTQPTGAWQTCTVASPTGTIAGGGVTVNVTCANNTYAVGGTVTGLSGSGLVLQDNAADDLSISADGTFTFATKVASGSPYAVTVKSAPSTQNCAVTSGSGTVAGAAISDVAVTCTDATTCATANEGSSVTLTCPTGQTITAIDFASYGTPNGSCGSFTTSGCDAATSVSTVTNTCKGLNSCTVQANNGVFGDPCYGTYKRLYVQAHCQ